MQTSTHPLLSQRRKLKRTNPCAAYFVLPLNQHIKCAEALTLKGASAGPRLSLTHSPSAVWAAYIWKLLSDISGGQVLIPACEVCVNVRRSLTWSLILFYLAASQCGPSSSERITSILSVSNSLPFFCLAVILTLSGASLQRARPWGCKRRTSAISTYVQPSGEESVSLTADTYNEFVHMHWYRVHDKPIHIVWFGLQRDHLM